MADDLMVAEATGRRYLSWDQLLGRWAKVVAAVVAGYAFTIYDYRNDLDVRSLIQDVLDACSARGVTVPDHVIRQLSEADSSFMSATREGASQLATRNRGPWATRVPITPGAELQRDIESEHL